MYATLYIKKLKITERRMIVHCIAEKQTLVIYVAQPTHYVPSKIKI